MAVPWYVYTIVQPWYNHVCIMVNEPFLYMIVPGLNHGSFTMVQGCTMVKPCTIVINDG